MSWSNRSTWRGMRRASLKKRLRYTRPRSARKGQRTIILDSSQLGAADSRIHSAHPIELDRVLGMEANFAGMSFLTIEKLRKLRYGSEIVNVVADARLEHGPGLGTFAYDDEGVPAQCTPIIHEWALHRLSQQSRNSARPLGKSAQRTATMRTESWNRLPIQIRMTNISINPGAPGNMTHDLIADTDDAILMETNRSWSIDDRRYHFQFSTEIGWEIKGGKKLRMLKNPSYSGITTEFWNSCDAICSRDHWTLWGTPNCGKGQPMQTMGTGHGARHGALSQCQEWGPRSRNDARHDTTCKRLLHRQVRCASGCSSRVEFRECFSMIVGSTWRPLPNGCYRMLSRSGRNGSRDPRCDRRADAFRKQHHSPKRRRADPWNLRPRGRGRPRTARAATNKTDDESLRRVVAVAASLALNQPENPDLLPMLGRQKYQKVARFSDCDCGGNAAGPRNAK